MTDMRYFARSKLSSSLVQMKNFSLTSELDLSQDTYFVKRGRTRHLSLNELGEKSQATIILDKFVSKT